MELKDWLEKKYLEWQLEQGRATISDFAEFLGVSRAYITLLLNGQRDNLSMQTALFFADRLNDDTVLDILGYARPQPRITDDQLAPLAALIMQFPEEMRPRIRQIMVDVLEKMLQSDEPPSEEEALKLMAERILSELNNPEQ